LTFTPPPRARLHSFSFKDVDYGETIAGALRQRAQGFRVDRNLDHIETLTIKEVFL
jgi:hypothetical protein